MSSGPPSLIKVALVEDDPELRVGLAFFLNHSDGVQCVAACSSGEQALQELPQVGPDVALMDIRLSGFSGVECVRRLKVLLPELRIMMLTVFESDEYIYESLAAGAHGYVTKNIPLTKLLEEIKDLAAGGSPMSNAIARKVVEAFTRFAKPARETDNLTGRERQILEQLAAGKTNKEIAAEVGISQHTVRGHLYKIYEKLQVRNRTEAVKKIVSA